MCSRRTSQSAATVVAVEIYRTSFGGGRNEGLSSALGVLLFLAVIPAMLFNVWRWRRYVRGEVSRRPVRTAAG